MKCGEFGVARRAYKPPSGVVVVRCVLTGYLSVCDTGVSLPLLTIGLYGFYNGHPVLADWLAE